MNEQDLQECLLRGYGYRKHTELVGEYVAQADGSVTNTLHTVELWTRDGVLPPNPWNDEPEELEDQNDEEDAIARGLTWRGRTCNANCGYCGGCT